MTDDYELVTSATVNESMIRKIGENEYLKIIPTEKIIEISTIEQNKITEPIKQTDEIIIKACPKEVKLFKNQNHDNKYETVWETTDGKTFSIPSSDIKTIHSLLKAKGVLMDEDTMNISNILSMIIKQDTLKKKIDDIKEEI